MDKATKYRAKKQKPSNLFGPPKRFAWWLKPVAWLLSAEGFRAKITKVNMKGVKSPFILLCNHSSFVDFKVATKAVFPHGYNNIVAIDGFIGREWIMRKVGCLCKRKYTNDIGLVLDIKKIIKEHKDIVCIYPEGRYTYTGTSGPIPKSTGKLARMLGVPVVTLNMSGNFINSPYWNRGARKVPLRARMEQIITAEETKTLSVDELNARIIKGLSHDDFKYQQDNNIRIKKRDNAQNFHLVLYQCPNCEKEFSVSAGGNSLSCSNCGAEYTLTEYGRFEKTGGGTEFPHPPEWFHWQRENVRKQIAQPNYKWQDECVVWTLKDSNGFQDLEGTFTLTHNKKGFALTGVFDGKKQTLTWPTEQQYTIHDEIGDAVGQAISLSTKDQTWYIFPKNRPLEIVKLRLAAEEMHKFVMKDKALAIATCALD